MKLLVAVPMLTPSIEFFTSWTNLWTQLMKEQDAIEVGYKFTYRKPTFIADESFAQLALDTDCTHILFMDDDIYDVTLADLRKLVDADKDVIGGVMYATGTPYNLCASRLLDPKRDLSEVAIEDGSDWFTMYPIPEDDRKGIQEANLISLGLTLVKTDVFRKIEKPWFFDTKNWRYSDSAFLNRCKNAGIKVYAHFDVWLNHRGITKENQPAWCKIYDLKGQGGLGVPIPPKYANLHRQIMMQVTEEAQKRFDKTEAQKIKFY